MSSTELPVRYCFDRFELQPGERRLLVGGAPTALAPRAFDLLVALVERAGQLVSKECLLEQVWPRLVVEENNLQVQISTLRKLLGPDAIATVAGKGYRFTRELLAQVAQGGKPGPGAQLDPGPDPAAKSDPQVNADLLPACCRHNLPHSNSLLIGRSAEMAQLQHLLANHALVTLTGAGGVGKTRLTLEVAHQLLPRFAHGVWLLELASVSDPEALPALISNLIGGHPADARLSRQALMRRLQDKNLLLLLDNCEHLLEAVADLVHEILSCAPLVQILTTSQEVLGLDGEYVFRLPSLSLPASKSPGLDDALASDAVSLFLDRAHAAGWSVCCDAENAPLIAAICRRLDGIALAIEMAAARVPMLGLNALAQLLDERFHVLTMGRRAALPRHRTLHATLDWSHGLLSASERVVFRRIGYFVGDFTLAAAIAVAAIAVASTAVASDTAADTPALDQYEVINCITSLVAKSLLVADLGGLHARYHLLESTRAYAMEKLCQAGEIKTVARAAAQHYQWMFKPCFDDWTRLSDSEFEARYTPELDNVRQSLDWAFGLDGDALIGIDLSGCSGTLWCNRSLLAEARIRIDLALAQLTPQTPLALQAEVWLAAAAIFYWRRSDRGAPVSAQALQLAREAGDPVRLGYVLVTRACCMILRDDDGSAPLLAEAHPLLLAAKRMRLLAMLHKAYGISAAISGQVERSISEYRIALDLATRAGADLQMLNAQENLADSFWLAGDLDSALREARAVVQLGQKSRYALKASLGWMLANLFGILVERGRPQDLDEALTFGRQAMPYVYEAECTWITIDHYSLRLAKLGHFESAARIVGWSDAYYHTRSLKRQGNETRALQSCRDLLAAWASGTGQQAAQLTRWLEEGAGLSEEEIVHLAVKL
jgi:predicted ATPase/DNA-binding winged helix-turn-helix (wHTH) protein